MKLHYNNSELISGINGLGEILVSRKYFQITAVMQHDNYIGQSAKITYIFNYYGKSIYP